MLVQEPNIPICEGDGSLTQAKSHHIVSNARLQGVQCIEMGVLRKNVATKSKKIKVRIKCLEQGKMCFKQSKKVHMHWVCLEQGVKSLEGALNETHSSRIQLMFGNRCLFEYPSACQIEFSVLHFSWWASFSFGLRLF